MFPLATSFATFWLLSSTRASAAATACSRPIRPHRTLCSCHLTWLSKPSRPAAPRRSRPQFGPNPNAAPRLPLACPRAFEALGIVVPRWQTNGVRQVCPPAYLLPKCWVPHLSQGPVRCRWGKDHSCLETSAALCMAAGRRWPTPPHGWLQSAFSGSEPTSGELAESSRPVGRFRPKLTRIPWRRRNTF
jgi:hypothetical protein